MKLRILFVSCILALQGCATSFDERFSDEGFLQENNINDTSDYKQKPYIKYNKAFLGKKTVYSEKQKILLNKKVSINTYELTPIRTLLDAVSRQVGSSYKIDEVKPGSESESSLNESLNVNFDGTLAEFIRYVSALYDMDVELTDENIIRASAYSTYAINLDFYGQDNKFETKMDLSGNEATSSGGLTGKSEIKFQSTFWTDVEDMVKKYVSSGVYNIFKDASVLTFSAKPSEYRALLKVLNEYQKLNSRQYIVSYMIFVLDKNKVNSLKGGLSLSYKNGGTNIGINTTLLQTITGGVTVGRDFYSGADPKMNIGAQLDATYQLTGSKILQKGTFVTRNNTPIPLNLTNSQYFISGRTVTMNDNFANTEVETSQIITGTSFFLTPRALSDGRIEVASGFTKKVLNSIDVLDNVQLPNVSTSEMFNTSVVSPGSLVVVARYDSGQEIDQRSAMLLGGGLDKENTDSTILMVVGIDNFKVPFVEQ
ncbi:type II and III secretion system protein [Salmonella enterica]|nr:type II and III secretion system protein [Salmonella enterica subsp. enterica serovar Stanley]EGS9941588.1 type II and III secretion system protein [Salmonella enterica]